jgi:hypothetical protein
MNIFQRLFPDKGKGDDTASKIGNESSEASGCTKCAGLSYEHDSYFGDYICVNCGWTTKALPRGVEKTTVKEVRRSALSARDKKQNLVLEERELKITELPKYHGSIMSRVLELRKSTDPISFVNKNIVVRCPTCGLDYNSEGFEVGLLAAIVSDSSRGIPTTFSSGGQGMYGRASRGLCPNPYCTSTTAVVVWHGGELGSEHLIPDKAAKEEIRSSEVLLPSQSTENVSCGVYERPCIEGDGSFLELGTQTREVRLGLWVADPANRVNWKMFEKKNLGFRVQYPRDWCVDSHTLSYTMLRPKRDYERLAPLIRISYLRIRAADDALTKFMGTLILSSQQRFRVVGTYPTNIPKATHSMCYEYRDSLSPLTALSLIVQREDTFYEVAGYNEHNQWSDTLLNVLCSFELAD